MSETNELPLRWLILVTDSEGNTEEVGDVATESELETVMETHLAAGKNAWAIQYREGDKEVALRANNIRINA